MNTEILSIILTTLMALFTASIPLIQSVIKRKSDQQNFKIEYLYKSKLEAFKDLMDAFGKFRRNGIAHIDIFLSCLCKSMLFCSDEVTVKILSIIKNLENDNYFNLTYKTFETLIPYFSSEIQDLQNILFGALDKKIGDRTDKTKNTKNNTENNK